MAKKASSGSKRKAAKGSKKKAAKSTRKTAAKGTKKKAAKGARKKAAKRERIDTGSDTRFVRRGRAGKFKESDDVSRSLSVDSRKKAKTRVKAGQGDKGDR
jgi:hypothetical protein